MKLGDCLSDNLLQLLEHLVRSAVTEFLAFLFVAWLIWVTRRGVFLILARALQIPPNIECLHSALLLGRCRFAQSKQTLVVGGACRQAGCWVNVTGGTGPFEFAAARYTDCFEFF